MKIRDLMTAFGPSVPGSQRLDQVMELMTEQERDYLIVTGEDEQPAGTITYADMEQVKRSSPDDWGTTHCAAVMEPVSGRLSPEDEVETIVELLTYNGVRPLLVHQDDQPVGVIEPTAVFQWCAEHRPEDLDKLAYLASQEERSHYPETWEHSDW